MEADSRDAEPRMVNRQLREAIATDTPLSSNLIEDKELNGELRKAALRWSIYRFPLKYTPTKNQKTKRGKSEDAYLSPPAAEPT